MAVHVITPPTEVVSLDEAKRHLRVDHDDDDVYITMLVVAAAAWLDGPAGWLARALGVQTLELVSADFGWDSFIPLPYPPLIDIVSVTYVDPDGVPQIMSSADYQQIGCGLSAVGGSGSWPAVQCQSDAVRIQYRAGYGVSPDYSKNEIPMPVKVAMLMLVGQWYQIREPVAIGSTVAQLPFAVEALLGPYRVFS